MRLGNHREASMLYWGSLHASDSNCRGGTCTRMFATLKSRRIDLTNPLAEPTSEI